MTTATAAAATWEQQQQQHPWAKPFKGQRQCTRKTDDPRA